MRWFDESCSNHFNSDFNCFWGYQIAALSSCIKIGLGKDHGLGQKQMQIAGGPSMDPCGIPHGMQ